MTGPTVPAAATRYFAPGLTHLVIVPTIASATLDPTLVELDAGTDVSGDVADVAGFSVSTQDIATPSLGERFVPSVPGQITADASTVTFYADADGADIRQTLTQGQDTYAVWLDGGLVTGSAMDVYKVTVSAVSLQRSVTDTPKIVVSFTIRAYAQGLTYPTS